ncbi:DNA-directed RNA polymerase subunit RPC12/RpoP [Bradyrhizobium sp. LM2.7]
MTARQGELLPKPPRRSRGQLMVIVDARHDETATVEFECPKCRYRTDWTRFDTVTEAKRRLPCPRCNTDQAAPLRALFR